MQGCSRFVGLSRWVGYEFHCAAPRGAGVEIPVALACIASRKIAGLAQQLPAGLFQPGGGLLDVVYVDAEVLEAVVARHYRVALGCPGVREQLQIGSFAETKHAYGLDPRPCWDTQAGLDGGSFQGFVEHVVYLFGTEGVGEASTRSVVAGSMLIIVTNVLLVRLIFFFYPQTPA